jgi:membrane-associated protease RseP (regulator of RpoE activity)
MKNLLLASLVVGLLGTSSICLAAAPKEKKAPKEKQQVQKEEQSTPGGYAYLGIGIEPLHPAMASHLGGLLENGQGVLVEQVAEKSPASKAGLKPHDIVTRYNGEKVYSPEQLVDLVRQGKPGNEVTLGIIRKGKAETVKLTLGEHQVAMMGMRPMREHRAFRPVAPEENENAWKLFDSMTFKRLDENRFQAVINYRNEKGEIEQHKFEGTRNEIRKDIESEKDMSATEQQQLLQALSLGGRPLEFRLPGFGYFPGGVLWDFQPTND